MSFDFSFFQICLHKCHLIFGKHRPTDSSGLYFLAKVSNSVIWVVESRHIGCANLMCLRQAHPHPLETYSREFLSGICDFHARNDTICFPRQSQGS
jgi:hypothetical protein